MQTSNRRTSPLVMLVSFLSFTSEEVCILSASGTAAVLNPRFLQDGTVEVCLEQRLSWQPGYFSIGSEKGEVDFFPQNQDSSSLLG